MSYILEALKKAQAERQLGSAPTLHAMPIHAGDSGAGGARPPYLRLAIAAAALGLAAIAALVWWQPPAVPTPAVAPAPDTASAWARPAPNPPYEAPGRVGSAAAEPTRTQAPAPAHAATSPAHRAPPVLAPAPAPTAAAKPAPIAEDLPPTLRELPDSVQREVPGVAIGGYIYSKNPEDRLLLVDKALRHEGEEVAPGLTLEKLLPKAAIMRYKGYRYRVPY